MNQAELKEQKEKDSKDIVANYFTNKLTKKEIQSILVEVFRDYISQFPSHQHSEIMLRVLDALPLRKGLKKAKSDLYNIPYHPLPLALQEFVDRYQTIDKDWEEVLGFLRAASINMYPSEVYADIVRYMVFSNKGEKND